MERSGHWMRTVTTCTRIIQYTVRQSSQYFTPRTNTARLLSHSLTLSLSLSLSLSIKTFLFFCAFFSFRSSLPPYPLLFSLSQVPSPRAHTRHAHIITFNTVALNVSLNQQQTQRHCDCVCVCVCVLSLIHI